MTVLIAGTWLSRCCVPDASSPNEGVSPSPCPVLAPPGFGGLLRLMVRVIWGSQWELPRRVRFRGPHTPPAHHTIWSSRTSPRGSSDRARPSISFGASFWRWRFGCAASVRKSSVDRVRSRTYCYAFPGRWERRAALEDSVFSWVLKAGRLVPGGAGRSSATASGSFLPGKCMRRWLGLGGHIFLLETGLVPSPGGESFVSFLFCSATGTHCSTPGQWYPKLQKKSSFLFLRVPRGRG